MTKLQNETYLSFIERVHKALLDKKINLNDWCQSLTGEILYSKENLRRCSQFLTKVLDQLNQDENKYYTSDQRLNDLKMLKLNLKKKENGCKHKMLNCKQLIENKHETKCFKNEFMRLLIN